jgi:hypothetical protein
VPEQCSNHSGIPAAVQDTNHRERLFVRRIHDHVVTNSLEAQRSCGEVRTIVTDIRERHQRLDGVVDLVEHTICRLEILGSDVSPRFLPDP